MDTVINKFIGNTDPSLIGVGVLAIIVALVVIYLFYRNKRPADEKQIAKIIAEASDDFVRDVVISDGMYGYQFIDYLVLLPGEILVLGVQHYEGHIFGAENIEQWAQVVNKKSYKFENPLHRYVVCAQTLNGLVKGLNVHARVIFTSVSNFPKGVPVGVWQMNDIRSEIEKLSGGKTTDSSLQKLWHELLDLSNQHKVDYIKEKQEN